MIKLGANYPNKEGRNCSLGCSVSEDLNHILNCESGPVTVKNTSVTTVFGTNPEEAVSEVQRILGERQEQKNYITKF